MSAFFLLKIREEQKKKEWKKKLAKQKQFNIVK